MPPKRRGAASARPNQSTLTFNGRSSKVTKPGANTPSVKSKPLSDISTPTKPLTADIIDPATVEADTRSEAVVLSKAQSEAARTAAKKTPEEEAALKLGETQIKKYWRAKERERKVPRVHQEDVGLHERILREWDISAQYGPSTGLTRLKRWQRANKLGLKPPLEVLAVLLLEQEADNIRAQRSHVDELMSSRFGDS